MKIPNEEKERLIFYLDNAIKGLNENLTNLRNQIKFFIGEKQKLQNIRKYIK